MREYYNARKAAQVIAYFACKNKDKKLHVVKAVKLVYLADRSSIEKYGFPILDEPHVSMPKGPVNSYTYSRINGEAGRGEYEWSNYLEDRAEHQIAAKKRFSHEELDELSEADIECLNDVWKKFGNMGRFDLVDWTHDRKNIPEWEDPSGSSFLIPLERIMTMVGLKNPDEQAAIVKEHNMISAYFS